MNLRTVANALVLGLICALVSCNLNNDDDYSYSLSDDAALTNITFGTLYQNVPKGSGSDVTVKSFTGSAYALQVDQVNKTISNEMDSLPQYTDLKRITLAVSTFNSGVPAIWDDSLKLHFTVSSSTEIDFTKERDFFVFSSDGTAKATYKTKIVAHEEKGDTVTWGKGTVVDLLKGLTDIQAVANSHTLFVLGKKGNESVLLCHKDADDVNNWQTYTLAGFSENAMMVAGRDLVYVLDKGAKKMFTIEVGSMIGCVERPCAAVDEIKTLIGVIDVDPKSNINYAYSFVYALTNDNKIMESEDNGETWKETGMDVDASLLPESSITSCWQNVGANVDMERLFLLGTREGDEYATLWSKLYDLDQVKAEPWMYMPFAVDRNYKLPAMKNMSVVSYGDYLLAIGATVDENHGRYAKVYASKDHGITWKTDGMFILPEPIYVTWSEENRAEEVSKGYATDVVMVADSANRLWLISGGTGKVWRGRLNSMTWKNYKTSFK